MTIMEKPAAFIFDMDGVIIDSEPLHSKAKLDTFAHFGIPFCAEKLPHYMGRTSIRMFGEVLKTTDRHEVTPEAMAKYKHDRYEEILSDGSAKPVEGTLQLIAALRKRGVTMALASSSWRPAIATVLALFGLEDVFAAISSGDDVSESKPDPAIYLLTAKRLGVLPEGCWVLEDTKNGIAAAKGAGMRCIGYRNPQSGEQDLSSADCLVESVADITLGWE